VPVVLDGAITLSAALVAVALAPSLSEHLIASHAPAEPAGPIALAHLGLVPIIDLQLRLGEGSGALLAVPIIRAAAAVVQRTARLDQLG
ncbi:MAG: nicotinate-nucleotide--dimethylbenzimidazole phosphoribosyltransferase, partial [Candidatus Microthrix parvicella]